MDKQSHIVSGIYTTRAEAQAVSYHLIESGLTRQQITIAISR